MSIHTHVTPGSRQKIGTVEVGTPLMKAAVKHGSTEIAVASEQGMALPH